MFVERILPAARERLVTIKNGAPVIEAAKLLLDRHADLLVVCGDDELMAGITSVRHV
jgi:CBS domain-containing protein